MGPDRNIKTRFGDSWDQTLCIIQTQEKELQIFTTPEGQPVAFLCEAWGWKSKHVRQALLDLHDIINNSILSDDRWWRVSIDGPVDVYISTIPAKFTNTVNFKPTNTSEKIYNALVQLQNAIEEDNKERPQ